MAFPGIAYDMWCDFEGLVNGTTPNSGTLASSTHGAAGTWTVIETGTPLLGANALEDGGHTFTGDAGARGLSLDPNNASAYVKWALPANKTTLSLGFWLKTGTYTTAFMGGPIVLDLYDAIGAGDFFNLRDELSVDNNYRQITLQNLAGNAGVGAPGNGTITNATWYWVTVKFVKAGTCSLAVYDVNMVQVGPTLSFTDASGCVGIDELRLGNEAAAAYVSGTLEGFDDVIVDYTTAVFPLLPASAGVVPGDDDGDSFQIRRN